MTGVEGRTGFQMIDQEINNGGEWRQGDAEAVARLIQNSARAILGDDLEKEGIRHIKLNKSRNAFNTSGIMIGFESLKHGYAPTLISIRNGMGWGQGSKIYYLGAAIYIDALRKKIARKEQNHEGEVTVRRVTKEGEQPDVGRVINTQTELNKLRKLERKMQAKLNKFAKHNLERTYRCRPHASIILHGFYAKTSNIEFIANWQWGKRYKEKTYCL